MALLNKLKPYKIKGKPLTGVFYQEHDTRKHGIEKDRLLIIRYTIQGKTRTETYGWLSQGYTPQEAQTKINIFRKNAKTGTGATSLAEEKAEEREAIKQEAKKQEEEDRKNTTFKQFFEKVYFPQCKIDKAKSTAGNEELLFRNWINPVIGELTFDEISIDHLDKIKSNMLKGKRPAAKKHGRDKNPKAKDAHLRRNAAKPMSARSIQYALAVIRQVWNRACASNPPLAYGSWPGASKAFKKPKADNQRRRFLTRNEVALLLEALKTKSQDVHDMALLALHCGMRAGEIFSLTWDKVNLPKGELLLVDTKNGESRVCYLTDASLAMLRQRSMNCEHKRIVFVSVIGKKEDGKKKELKPYTQVPVTFSRTVKELGLNEGVTDTRDRIVFHSLRHTYASWLVENGASLPIVRDLLGHKNLIMTSRYSHVSAEAQKDAVRALNQSMQPTGKNVIQLNKNG